MNTGTAARAVTDHRMYSAFAVRAAMKLVYARISVSIATTRTQTSCVVGSLKSASKVFGETSSTPPTTVR